MKPNHKHSITLQIKQKRPKYNLLINKKEKMMLKTLVKRIKTIKNLMEKKTMNYMIKNSIIKIMSIVQNLIHLILSKNRLKK